MSLLPKDSAGSAVLDESHTHYNKGNGKENNDNNNGNNSSDVKQPSSMSPFSMPGVLHFLQQEWSRYELDRAQWELERSELKARISFLIGERKSQENLKHDLVRRIKMLEYALKQERAKFQEWMDNHDRTAVNLEEETDEKQDLNDCAGDDTTANAVSSVPLDIDAILPPPPAAAVSSNTNANSNTGGAGVKNVADSVPPSSTSSDQAWAHARETLRQYLQEIGYTEHMLEARCYRVKQLLGVHAQQQQQGENIGNSGGGGTKQRDDDGPMAVGGEKGDGGGAFAKLQMETEKMLDDAIGSDGGGGGGSDCGDDAVDKNKSAFEEVGYTEHMLGGRCYRVKQLQQQQKGGGAKKKDGNQSTMARGEKGFTSGGGSTAAAKLQMEAEKLLNDAIGNDGDDVEKFADIKSGFEDDDDETVLQLRWNINYTLRSHYDSVRAMQFHPIEPMLITASEDGTAKLWDLNYSSVGAAKSEGGGGTKNAQSGTGIVDIEPLYTFRGHRGPILALDLAPLGETCYTGGLDGTICCWAVPQTNGMDIYQTFDPSVLQERLCGHSDAVWSLCFHAASNRLISASADGTIRIWIVGLADGAMPSPLLKTIQVSAGLDNKEASGDTVCPHSIDLVSTSDRQQLLCAYQCSGGGAGTRRSFCNIRDLETGQVVVNFQFGVDDQPSALNKILSHPTMSLSIAAGEDRKIHFFDNNTGKLISAPIAHVEGVSTLAIDPYGLYMLSGSHDGSVRLWNAEKRVCLQEIAAHRKKFGAGVMAVAFHPSKQLIGSSGADSLAKVYSPIRQSPRSSVVAAFGASPSSSPGSSGHNSVVGSPQKTSPISLAGVPAAPAKNK